MVIDPIIINPDLMGVLERYTAANIDEVSCLIAKFLGMFFESPFLETHEIDNFILRNGGMLCRWLILSFAIECWLLSINLAVHGSSMKFKDMRSPICEQLFSYVSSLSMRNLFRNS